MIKDILQQQRKKILDRWTEEVLDAYPAESGSFLKREKDRFRNPVGHTIAEGLERIYDGLLEAGTVAAAEQAVADIIRMRAVQQFSPSEATGFMIRLKGLIREMIGLDEDDSLPQIDKQLLVDFLGLEAILDRLTLFAFDCYGGCREAVFHASVKEARAGGMVEASIIPRGTD